VKVLNDENAAVGMYASLYQNGPALNKKLMTLTPKK
jgi:hypothetical protein